MRPNICGSTVSNWPHGLLRCGSAAARLLRLWVRIPPGAWMSVLSVVCCQVEVSKTSWSLVQRSLTDCGVSLCVIQKARERGGPGPLGAVAPIEKKNQTCFMSPFWHLKLWRGSYIFGKFVHSCIQPPFTCLYCYVWHVSSRARPLALHWLHTSVNNRFRRPTYKNLMLGLLLIICIIIKYLNPVGCEKYLSHFTQTSVGV
jgi:hypothetical protein